MLSVEMLGVVLSMIAGMLVVLLLNSVDRKRTQSLRSELEQRERELSTRETKQDAADQRKVEQYHKALEDTALRYAEMPEEERQLRLSNIQRHRLNRGTYK